MIGIFIRLIRRRIVLAIIFALSLTYCLISFWQANPVNFKISDSDDDIARRPRPSFLWHTESDETNTTGATKVISCRNSIQGKVLIVDDRGYICSRSNLLSTGCCNLDAENTRRFACDTCKDNGCCSIYEYCISCCLNPDKIKGLKNILGKSLENVLLASVSDHFELCLAKCRTSSQSVHHENSYRDPRSKHCYGEVPLVEIPDVPAV